MAKLKVFRTPIGFHDAYVAAPSQKAALAAWGADADLFARGVAEKVTDPKLMKEPLSRPGEVVKVSRGRESDHFKAIGRSLPRRKEAKAAPSAKAPETKARPSAPRRPRPSRAALDRAEAALNRAEAAFEDQLGRIAAQEQALREERRKLRAEYQIQRARLELKVDEARDAYQQKIEGWAAP